MVLEVLVSCEIGWAAGSVRSTSDSCLVIANKVKLGGLWTELLKRVCLAIEVCHRRDSSLATKYFIVIVKITVLNSTTECNNPISIYSFI